MLKEASQVVVPLARVGVRLYATWRLNWVISVAFSQAPPITVLGFLVQGGVRMLVAARLSSPARSSGDEDSGPKSKGKGQNIEVCGKAENNTKAGPVNHLDSSSLGKCHTRSP
jgi:hypothetical protein